MILLVSDEGNERDLDRSTPRGDGNGNSNDNVNNNEEDHDNDNDNDRDSTIAMTYDTKTMVYSIENNGRSKRVY